MAIDTANKKLALIELGSWWETGLPITPGSFGTDDIQQLLMGYPGIAYSGDLEVAKKGWKILGPKIGMRIGGQ